MVIARTTRPTGGCPCSSSVARCRNLFGIAEGNPSLDADVIDRPCQPSAIKDRYCVPGFPSRQMLLRKR